MVPNMANIPKNHCFPKKIANLFGNIFIPKFCHCLKHKVSVLTKQSILNYLLNEYPTLERRYTTLVVANLLQVYSQEPYFSSHTAKLESRSMNNSAKHLRKRKPKGIC